MFQTQLSVNELGFEPFCAESDKMSFVNDQGFNLISLHVE